MRAIGTREAPREWMTLSPYDCCPEARRISVGLKLSPTASGFSARLRLCVFAHSVSLFVICSWMHSSHPILFQFHHFISVPQLEYFCWPQQFSPRQKYNHCLHTIIKFVSVMSWHFFTSRVCEQQAMKPTPQIQTWKGQNVEKGHKKTQQWTEAAWSARITARFLFNWLNSVKCSLTPSHAVMSWRCPSSLVFVATAHLLKKTPLIRICLRVSRET